MGAWLPAWKHALLVLVGVRVGLLVVGVLGRTVFPAAGGGSLVPGRVPPPIEGGVAGAWQMWERWDALWYLTIADNGYTVADEAAAFFPLFPMLVRAVSVLTGGRMLAAGMIVTHVALLAALVMLYRLTEMEWGELAARRTVLYLCLFPTAYFLFSPYTESLFLALVVGCLYAARQSRWALAGGLGAAASATRSAGVLLGAALLVEAALQVRARRADGVPVRRLVGVGGRGALAAVAATGGLLAYLGYWGTQGQWRRPLEVQGSLWGKDAAWPWEALAAGVRAGWHQLDEYHGDPLALEMVVAVVVLVALAAITPRLRLTYAVLAWGSVLLPLLAPTPEHPLQSFPRFALVVFPVYWAFARFSERFRAHDVVVSVSAGGLAIMSVMYTLWYRAY